jgi:hypothetical protein
MVHGEIDGDIRGAEDGERGACKAQLGIHEHKRWIKKEEQRILLHGEDKHDDSEGCSQDGQCSRQGISTKEIVEFT